MRRSAPSACWRRSRSAGPPSPHCRSRSPSCSVSPQPRHPARSCASSSEWTRGGCSREARSGLSSTFRPMAGRNGSSSSSCSRRESPRSETPAGPLPARRRGEPASRLRARVRALGRLPDRARRCPDPERVRPAVDDGTDRRRAAASCLPSPGTTAPRRAGVTTRHRSRAARCPGQGGGNRVRRHSAFRARRSRPSGELAGERPARADVRQREPPGARERRDPFPRQLRGGTRLGRWHNRPGRQGRVVARRRVSRAPEPRRARQLRRHPPLASPRDGHAPAVPHRRRAHRDRAGALVLLDDGRGDSHAACSRLRRS